MTKVRLLLAIFIAFTFGCGSDDGNDGSSENAVTGENTGENTGDNTGTKTPASASDLHSPPASTKGFNVCGEEDGETIYCIPGAYCDDARSARCDEGCNSDSDCSEGTSCTTAQNIKACRADENPDTASENSGTTYCGFREGKIFTCNPGAYCADPRSNRCETGCLTEVNCLEGEYCRYGQETVFGHGTCVQGEETQNSNSSSSICADDDQNCCCLNGEYFSCPSGAAVDACGGGDVGECLDMCSVEDPDCQERCFEMQEPDSSQCTRIESNDGNCE